MKLFIPRIPNDSVRSQLRHFIESGVNTKSWNPFFTKQKYKVISYEIVTMTEPNGTKENHAFIEIVPNKVAQEVIRRLYRKIFNGKRVIVRQYIERKSHKDLDPQDDRRRPNLKVEKERYVEIEGLEHFSRTSSNN